MTLTDSGKPRPTWNQTWLSVALIMSDRSTCSRRRVGAVLVKDNRLISSGYNGATPGKQHCTDGGCPRGQLSYEDVPKDADYNLYPCVAVHAEANALLRAGYSSAKGGTLYVTQPPCLQCSNLIQAAEVKEVVVWPGL